MSQTAVPVRGRAARTARRTRLRHLALHQRRAAVPRDAVPAAAPGRPPDRGRRRPRLLRLRPAAVEPPAADDRLRHPPRLRRPDAVAAGRRLRALHKGFKGVREDGQRYYALEPEAYAWVHATLIETYVAGHAHFGRADAPRPDRPLLPRVPRPRPADRRPRARPAATWAGFRDYFDATSASELVRTDSVDRVLRRSATPPPPPIPLPEPLWRAARVPARRGAVARRRRADDARAARAARAHLDRARRARIPRARRVSRGADAGDARAGCRSSGPAQLRLRRRAIARGPLGASPPPRRRRVAPPADALRHRTAAGTGVRPRRRTTAEDADGRADPRRRARAGRRLGPAPPDDGRRRRGAPVSGRMTVYRRFGAQARLLDALAIRECRRCLATDRAARSIPPRGSTSGWHRCSSPRSG